MIDPQILKDLLDFHSITSLSAAMGISEEELFREAKRLKILPERIGWYLKGRKEKGVKTKENGLF